jgi:hypothetical protein
MICVYQLGSIHRARCEAAIRAAIRAALGAVPGVLEVDPDQHTDQAAGPLRQSRAGLEQIPARLAAAGFRSAQSSPRSPQLGNTHPALRVRSSRLGRYGLLAATVVVTVTACLGYVLYPRFDLPAVQGAGLVLAAAAGVAL